jgi:hypothetical protein
MPDELYRVEWIGNLKGQYRENVMYFRAAVGQRGTEAVSEQLCPCVTLIPIMGVKSAGRIFLPAVDKNDINLNKPVAGYKTAISNLITAMIAGFSLLSGTIELVIYSRKLNSNSVCSTFNLSPVIGYQRRRARPVGV